MLDKSGILMALAISVVFVGCNLDEKLAAMKTAEPAVEPAAENVAEETGGEQKPGEAAAPAKEKPTITTMPKVSLEDFLCGSPDPTDPIKLSVIKYGWHSNGGDIRCSVYVVNAPENSKFICGLKTTSGEMGRIERELAVGKSLQTCDFKQPSGGWPGGPAEFYTRQVWTDGINLNGSSTSLSFKK